MASLTALPQTAAQILELFVGQLEEQGVDMPARQFVAPGSQVVWDGEQMSVALMGIAQGQPAAQEPQTFIPQAVHYYATFGVSIVREVTTLNTDGFAAVEPPTPSMIGADGAQTINDAAQLVLAASQLHAAYSLTEPGEGYAMEGLLPLGPEGALAGNRLLLSLSLT